MAALMTQSGRVSAIQSRQDRWPEAASERLSEFRSVAQSEIAKSVVGEERAVDLLLLAALAGGHVLLEGAPGTGKTLLGASVARLLGVDFKRVQFTPDTTPSEISGRHVRRGGELVFEPGVVFTNVLLADEINRTPPRTQASLLEVMQEGQVTIEGRTHWVEKPFFVIATQNPYEHEGVFALPESQLDRFLFKITLDYGSEDDDLRMLRLPHTGVSPDMLGDIRPLFGPARFVAAQVEVDRTEVPDEAARYLVGVVRATRHAPGVELGASPRAAIHLLSAAKANARLKGRDLVTIADVKDIAGHVLRHRLVVDGTSPDEVVDAALESSA
jgi:MoxR-like ATPase